MDSVIIFEHNTYKILNCVQHNNLNIVYCLDINNKKITYFIQKIVNGKYVYIPFNRLIKALDIYQTPDYEDIENALNTFILAFNSKKRLEINEQEIISQINRFEKKLKLNSKKYDINECIKPKKSFIKLITSHKILNIYSLLVIGSLVGFIGCCGAYLDWKKTGNSTKTLLNSIIEKTEIISTAKGELYNSLYNLDVEYESSTDDSSKNYKYGASYWNYTDIPMMDVNFDSLIEKNDDTVAWLQVNHTNINYPVVQTNDNSYYLNHSFDKSYNVAGWLFLDYRSTTHNLKNNTIIYGHGRTDEVMFGSLDNILDESWYTNDENRIVKLSTPNMDMLWEVFSIYTIPAESYYLTTNFENDTAYQNFLNTIVERSIYDYNISVNSQDKILTLSTCLNTSGDRIVLHAKLVKTNKK